MKSKPFIMNCLNSIIISLNEHKSNQTFMKQRLITLIHHIQFFCNRWAPPCVYFSNIHMNCVTDFSQRWFKIPTQTISSLTWFYNFNPRLLHWVRRLYVSIIFQPDKYQPIHVLYMLYPWTQHICARWKRSECSYKWCTAMQGRWRCAVWWWMPFHQPSPAS